MGATERLFVLPRGLAVAPNLPCNAQESTLSAACQRGWPTAAGQDQATYVGSYQPYAYLAPGLLMRLGNSPWSAWILGRATFALLSLGLIALALLALGATPIMSATVALTVTPMVVFLGSSLNPSGLETAAAVSFAAGLACVLRVGPPRWAAWPALMAGGVLLAATRSLGPYFVVAIAALFAIAFGNRAAWSRLAKRRLPVAIAVVLISVAAVANVAWEQTQQPHLTLGSTLLSDLSLHTVPRLIGEIIGRFGWLEAPLPAVVTVAWLALVAGLFVLGMVVGRWRQRLALCGLVAVVGGLLVLLRTVLPIDTGFTAQGRYVLPLAVVIPIMAGELVRRYRDRLAAPIVPEFAALAVVVAALVQAMAFYLNSRRYAVGTSGPTWFVSRALWSPSGGWWIWLGVGLGGAALLATAGLMPSARAVRSDATAGRPSRTPAAARRRASIL